MIVVDVVLVCSTVIVVVVDVIVGVGAVEEIIVEGFKVDGIGVVIVWKETSDSYYGFTDGFSKSAQQLMETDIGFCFDGDR